MESLRESEWGAMLIGIRRLANSAVAEVSM
jgi:hypothetical protein